MDEIRTITVLGANGTMGALTGGLLAQNNFKVYFLSRSSEKSELALDRAVKQARSEIIKKNIICSNYDELERALSETDWIIECLAENLALKVKTYAEIDSFKKKGAIISTITSSLPLDILCQGRSEPFKKKFLGVHLFNPPTKMPLCELAPNEETDPEVFNYMNTFLKKKLDRVVIRVKNKPAYAANRIAFLIFCEIAKIAQTVGVETLDYLIGPYTGRVLPPFATIDLIGLDTSEFIIESLFKYTNDIMHDSFVFPEYIHRMIKYGSLGNKVPEKGGFYRKGGLHDKYVLNINTFNYDKIEKSTIEFVEKAKKRIHFGRYRDAFEILKKHQSNEADIVRRVLCTYIAYSYSCIGEVTSDSDGINSIDKAMRFGYHWAPPSAIMHLLGGPKEVIDMMKTYDILVPQQLLCNNNTSFFLIKDGKYFIAR